MKLLNLTAVLFFCLVFLNRSYAQNGKDLEKKSIVVIDPGHGGKDAGATTKKGIKEKDIALGIASKILVLNEKLFENPLNLFLTRYKDTLISLGDRAKLTQVLKADVFIALHCNQSSNRIASGTEVYIYPKSQVQAAVSAYLGCAIQKELTDELGFKSRGLKYGDFQVLRDNTSQVAILLELGFLSHGDEAHYLAKVDSQNAVALVILRSIIKFLRL